VSDITIPINTKTLDGYNLFIKCKRLPIYKISGNNIITDERSYNYVFETMENKSVDV
jgi:hypothetical protein